MNIYISVSKNQQTAPPAKKGRRAHGKGSTTVATVSHPPDIIIVDLGADRHPTLSGYAVTLPHQWALVMRQREDFKRANSGLSIQKGGIWRVCFMFKSSNSPPPKKRKTSENLLKKERFSLPSLQQARTCLCTRGADGLQRSEDHPRFGKSRETLLENVNSELHLLEIQLGGCLGTRPVAERLLGILFCLPD